MKEARTTAARILDARVLPYSLPLTRPWRTAEGERRRREGALLAVRATWAGDGGEARGELGVAGGDLGRQGLGEAAPLPGRTETLDRCRETLERAAGGLRTERPALEEALEWLEAWLRELRPTPAGSRAARAAVATALLDLRAREAGLPLAWWLAAPVPGGAEPATRVPVNAALPAGSLDETVEAARRAVAGGFRCLKLKVGREPDRDLERVRAVRDAVGTEVDLRLDANGAWTVAEAPRRLKSLASLGIEYVEQPLPAGSDAESRGAALADLARLRESSPIPLAADESASDPAAARAVLVRRAADVLILKPATLGGPDVALDVALRARRVGVEVVVTSALDGVVGRLAALHTAAALGPELRACGLATGGFLAAEVAEGEERLEAGSLSVPAGPGLGARLP